MDLQLASSLVGPMNVTRAFLPFMRKQRSGKIIAISSTAGIRGFEFGTAYAASKFGLDGFIESLQVEVAPFGIETMIVNPGFFRTELLTKESTQFATLSIADYTERRTQMEQFYISHNGKQGGDPVKLARALVTLAGQDKLPRRLLAGADAVGAAEQKIAVLQQEIDAHRELSSSLAIDQ
jgi:NAD(P)-dependent dehydrogenase (short-subunit alcohol dehydrogenase family)